jgi:hypothetical protein
MFVYTGRMIFKSYKPLKLEKGMYFLVRQNNEMVIIQLDHTPMNDDDYIGDYGYPVDPYIINQGNPNLDEDYIFVYPHQIGWWDIGEESDELYDITAKEINQILDNDCWVDVEVEEEDDLYGHPVPVFLHDKVVLSHHVPEEYENDDEDEYFFDDDEPYVSPNNENT